MRNLVKQWFPQASRRQRRQLEVGIIIFMAVMGVCVVAVLVGLIYFLKHRK
jgi:type VI protein secretion system component VasF